MWKFVLQLQQTWTDVPQESRIECFDADDNLQRIHQLTISSELFTSAEQQSVSVIVAAGFNQPSLAWPERPRHKQTPPEIKPTAASEPAELEPPHLTLLWTITSWWCVLAASPLALICSTHARLSAPLRLPTNCHFQHPRRL